MMDASKPRCCICDAPIRPDHKTVEMADASRTHDVCFDIVCAALSADAQVPPEVAAEKLSHLHDPKPTP